MPKKKTSQSQSPSAKANDDLNSNAGFAEEAPRALLNPLTIVTDGKFWRLFGERYRSHHLDPVLLCSLTVALDEVNQNDSINKEKINAAVTANLPALRVNHNFAGVVRTRSRL